MPSWISAAIDALSHAGIDVEALGLGWARVMPAVTIVPAFGLRALPPPARAVLAFALAACVLPAIHPIAVAPSVPWIVLALGEAARGLPVAIAAAVPLWSATMAGGVADALRGAQDTSSVPVVEGRASPLGVTLSLLASALFLAGGGPARVAGALASSPVAPHPIDRAAHDLTSGISIAVALGGPLLAAGVVIEVAAALVARAASPTQVHALLAPLRALGTIAVMALVLDRLTAALAGVVAASP